MKIAMHKKGFPFSNMAEEMKERALDKHATDGGTAKMSLKSQAPTNPCKHPISCVASSSIQALDGMPLN
jgi:hypothetical protein